MATKRPALIEPSKYDRAMALTGRLSQKQWEDVESRLRKVTEQQRKKRLYPTKAQRALLRRYRRKFGEQMFTLNERLYELKKRHREDKEIWSGAELSWASEQVARLVETVYAIVETGLPTKVKGGKMRRSMSLRKFSEKADMAKPYKERVKWALQNMEAAIDSLLLATPGPIADTEDASGALEAQEQFMAQYALGMRQLRVAHGQLYVTVNDAMDVRPMYLNEEESKDWHNYAARKNAPLPRIIKEASTIAADTGMEAHIYDADGDLVYEVKPILYIADDPESFAVRAAAKQTKKVRQLWGKAKPPGPGHELRLLTADQRRKATALIKSADRPVSIERLAREVGYHRGYVANPEDAEAKAVREDLMLHQLLWGQDF